MITLNYNTVIHYAITILSLFIGAFSKNDSKWSKSVTQSLAYIAMNAVKIVWKCLKSAPLDWCYPISVSTTRFGFSKQEHFTFVSFYGQCLRPWRQTHDSFRKNYFTLSCFLLRSREISRTLHTIPLMRWCRYRQTYYYDLGKPGQRKGVIRSGQWCKNAKAKFFASLHCWMKSNTKGKNLFRVYAVFYSTLLFRENGVYW